MKVGIEFKDKDIYTIAQILNFYLNEEVKLEDILIKMIAKNIGSSDLLFIMLQELEKKKAIEGKEGKIKVREEIKDVEEIAKKIRFLSSKNKKLFVTPLEVSKFYQCPRRLFLEKIVLAKEFKEEKGKTWDGEVIHLALNIFIKNIMKRPIENVIDYSVESALKKYEEKTNLTKEILKDFIIRFYDLLDEEDFKYLFTEKTLCSLKIGLTGTPDIIGIKENEIVPIDIKLGKLSSKGIKEEHLLQSVGEAILLEEFFRKKINKSYLIFFESKALVKINIDENMKKKFLKYKNEIEMVCKSKTIPEKGKMQNLERRACLGCHVKKSCDNIENLRRIS
ncbi:MAG: PD-(D/E)XK nuclease family protein [Candidatus Aenigmatarchaeota archaeon]